MPKQINSHEHYKINQSRKGNKLKLKIIPSNFLSSNISHKHLENDFDVDEYGDRKRDDEDDTSTTSSKMIREITYVFGSNFSLNNQCEYRIKIYVTNTVIIQEQFLVDIQTNIFISQMDNFCMFLQINNEESSIVKKFKTSAGKWKSVRVWWIPEFVSEVEVSSIEVETGEVPF